MDIISQHFPGFWIALGFALLAAEVLLFGFTTIILLFSGLAALTTGLLMMAQVLPETWVAGVASFGILTGIISALLWAPLRKLQNRQAPEHLANSDFIGLEFILDENITPLKPGKYRYSGIDWKVELAQDSEHPLHKGQRVRVVSVDVGIFRVQAVDPASGPH